MDIRSIEPLQSGVLVYRILVYQGSKFIGNYNDGELLINKPMWFDEKTRDLILPELKSEAKQKGYNLVIKKKKYE